MGTASRFALGREVVATAGEDWSAVLVGGGKVKMATGVDEDEAEYESLISEDPKLLLAVTEVSLLIVTPLTITTSPSTLVTLISTVVVPKPSEFSKKLYDCLVVECHVFPPSVLTSRLETLLLALTTCMLNQYADTPSLLWSSRAEDMGQSM